MRKTLVKRDFAVLAGIGRDPDLRVRIPLGLPKEPRYGAVFSFFGPRYFTEPAHLQFLRAFQAAPRLVRAGSRAFPELAQRANVSRQTISRIERAATDVGIEVVDRIAKALGTSIAELVVPAVPIGAAAARTPDQATLPALGAYAIIAIALVYISVETFKIWRARREDAFRIYFNKDMYFLYDEVKTKAMYFALNSMPVWSILNRNWFAGRRLPAIDDVFAKASKVSASTSPIEPR